METQTKIRILFNPRDNWSPGKPLNMLILNLQDILGNIQEIVSREFRQHGLCTSHSFPGAYEQDPKYEFFNNGGDFEFGSSSKVFDTTETRLSKE
jgi:hypothetical protein